MTDSYRIIIADDHAILRQGLRSILEKENQFSLSGEACNGRDLINLLESGVVPDALILDLTMPEMSGLEALRWIRQMNYSFKVLVLTMHKERDLLCQAFNDGADGYMLKDEMGTELLIALHTLQENELYLSPCMAKELPETCLVKSKDFKKPTAPVLDHCRRYIT